MAKELFACASIVFWVALGTSRPACAASPPEVGTALEFDTRILDSEVGARIESQLTDKLPPMLRHAGPNTTLRIQVIAFDADALDYEVQVELLRPGAKPVDSTVVCNACSENRLVSRILEEAPKLLQPSDEAPDLQPIEPEPRAEHTTARPRVRRIGPMGFMGVGLGILGIVGVSVGAQQLVLGDVERPSSDPRFPMIDNHRPRGAMAAALGAAALITGVALVAVDVKRHRSTRRHVAVHVSPAYVGFQIEQKF